MTDDQDGADRKESAEYGATEPAAETDEDRWADDQEGGNGDEDADEWKFNLDDVNVDGLVERQAIEPEAVSLESAVFVLLGAMATLGILFRMATLVG